ncbi:hypothetical protein B484DRAFT_446690 [Ochromonadaceae sp. CCMP2298]|nr:hypothetical protein B484DRAFT_446690 [Ochromonadaceae sp. CCMP2298]
MSYPMLARRLRSSWISIGQHRCESSGDWRQGVSRSIEQRQRDFENAGADRDAFAASLWQLNHRRRFTAATEAFEALPAGHAFASGAAAHAAVLAYGESHRPHRAREVLQSLPRTEVGPLSLRLLANAYASSNRLGSMEGLLTGWASDYQSAHPADTRAGELVRAMVRESSSGSSSSNSSSSSSGRNSGSSSVSGSSSSGSGGAVSVGARDSSGIGIGGMGGIEGIGDRALFPGLLSQPLPLGVWLSVVTLYGQRRAWRQCLQVLEYLEGCKDSNSGGSGGSVGVGVGGGEAGALYRWTPTEQGAALIAHSTDALAFPSFLRCNAGLGSGYGNATSTGTDMGMGMDAGVGMDADTDAERALQWSAIYHVTLRALCEGRQFDKAMRLLQRMREHRGEGGAVGAVGAVGGQADLTPQLPALISLLTALRTAGSVSADGAEEGQGGQNASERVLRRHQQAALSLGPDIGRLVGALAYSGSVPVTPYTSIPTSSPTSTSISTSISTSAPQVGTSARGLAREYVLCLCQLGLLEAAGVFVEQVKARLVLLSVGDDVKDVEKGGNKGGDFAGAGDADGRGVPGEGRWRVSVRGFSDHRGNSNASSWAAPYLQALREGGKWREARDVYGRIVNRGGGGGRAQGQAEMGVQGWGWQGKGRGRGGPTPSSLLMYHDACGSMRDAGQTEALADFLLDLPVAEEAL